MQQLLWIAAGGALGACSRFGVSLAAAEWFGPHLPWGTFAVNASGSLVLGFLMEFTLASETLPTGMRVMLTTGFLGAFTTFSTFSVESVRLIQRGDAGLALASIVGNLTAGLTLAWLGILIAQRLFTQGTP